MNLPAEVRRVDDDFAVAGQLQPADMGALAKAGFGTVICNRPDGEESGQPDGNAMREAAEEAGMAYHALPVSGGVYPPETVARFRAIRQEATAPVIAFCRTGNRSITLDTLANPCGISAEARLRRASAAGYDLSALSDSLG